MVDRCPLKPGARRLRCGPTAALELGEPVSAAKDVSGQTSDATWESAQHESAALAASYAFELACSGCTDGGTVRGFEFVRARSIDSAADRTTLAGSSHSTEHAWSDLQAACSSEDPDTDSGGCATEGVA